MKGYYKSEGRKDLPDAQISVCDSVPLIVVNNPEFVLKPSLFVLYYRETNKKVMMSSMHLSCNRS